MMHSIACVLGLVGWLVACRPSPAGESTAVEPVGGAAVADGGGDPYREPIDVPVINASRAQVGERYAAATSTVWTGSEAVFFAWNRAGDVLVGRMDAEGRDLGPAKVNLATSVVGLSHPVWRNGTISAVFDAYRPGAKRQPPRWISARPDGTVVSDVALDALPGWSLYSNLIFFLRGDEIVVLTSEDEVTNIAQERKLFGLATFDLSGRRKSSIPFEDCEYPGAAVGTRWGYVVACHYDRYPHEVGRAPRLTRVVGFREGEAAWVHEVPLNVHVTLGSDGERTLVVYSVGPADSLGVNDMTKIDFNDMVKIELLDADGKVQRTTRTPTIAPDRHRRPMVWTGKEYAAVSNRWIYRYSGDGELIGVWAVEPQCRRSFEATGLVWTGTAYIVTGDWGWESCMDVFGRMHTDESYLLMLKPLAPGLRWDPAADALESPYDDD